MGCLAVACAFLMSTGASGNTRDTWVEVALSEGDPLRADDQSSNVKYYRLRHELVLEGATSGGTSLVTLPAPDGEIGDFAVAESNILSSSFAETHPGLKCYRGASADGRRCHFVVYDDGRIVGIVRGLGSTVEIRETSEKGVYSVAWADHGPTACLVPGEVRVVEPGISVAGSHGSTRVAYRLALCLTDEFVGTWGGFIPALAFAMVLADIANDILEREVAISLNVVGVTWTSPDPFAQGDDTNSAGILGQTHSELTRVFGGAAFDVGHLITDTGPTSSGRAQIGIVCDGGSKGRGASDDNWQVLVHELGHQLGATHTFSAASPNDCLAERELATSYEPGSGSTIMSYGLGICADDIGVHDDYFHATSLHQIVNYTNNVSCGSHLVAGNNPPTALAGNSQVVPRETPFRLEATSSDEDGDPLTYCWEQYNPLWTQPLGFLPPLFRSIYPLADPSRSFGISDDPSVSNWENLPTVDGVMTFHLTVRDNHPGSGAIAWDLMNVTASGAPFRLTAPSPGGIVIAGSPLAVSWDVGSSTASDVKIIMGTPSRNYTIASSTPNDGYELVEWPCLASGENITDGRIQIEPIGTIYFSQSGQFTVLDFPPSIPQLIAPPSGSMGQPMTVMLDWQDVAGATRYSVRIQCPSGESIAGEDFLAESQYSYTLPESDYQWFVVAHNECGRTMGRSDTWTFSVGAGSTCSVPVLTEPVDSSQCVGIVGDDQGGAFAILQWEPIPGASGYVLRIDRSHPGPDACSSNSEIAVTGTEYLAEVDWGTTYVWSVKEDCPCAEYSPCWSFTTSRQPLNAPSLQSPSSHAEDVPLSGLVEWSPRGGAVGYRVQLGTECGSVDSVDVVGTTWAYSDLEQSTQYFWRVRSLDECGQASPSAACWDFTTMQVTGIDRVFFPDSLIASRGETDFEVPILIENLLPLQRIEKIEVRFPAEVFEVAGWTLGGTRSAEVPGVTVDFNDGSDRANFKITYTSDGSCSQSLPTGVGAVLTLLLNVKPDAPLGMAAITFNAATFRKCAGGNVDASEFDGEVNIVGPLAGTDRVYFPEALIAARGGTGFELPILIENLLPIQRVEQINIRFPREVFEVASWTLDGTRSAEIPGVTVNVTEGSDHANFKITYSPDQSCPQSLGTGVGAVVKLLLNIKPDAPLGMAALTIDEARFEKCGGGLVQPSVSGGQVNIVIPTDVGNLPPIARLTVLPHYPNPFTTNATIDVGLPNVSNVELQVFDVLGRRVSSRSIGGMGSGWQRIALPATDNSGRFLPSGVYFYRVTAAGEAITRKMVIAR